jgi:ribosome-associated protein
MRKQMAVVDQDELKKCIIDAMVDKKACNIVSIDLRNLNNAFSDYFIVCTGTSTTHVEAVGDYIEEMTFRKYHQKPFQKEGFENKEWILLDYFDIVVHIFLEEKREFFAIEELWGDGILEHIQEADKPVLLDNQKSKK